MMEDWNDGRLESWNVEILRRGIRAVGVVKINLGFK
jgi:hypothetical protein